MDRRRAGALLALAACVACSAAAPTASSNHTALDLYEGNHEGCYYNFQHYGEGDRIMTNEPCLNCTCHNRMLMCYLRVCPFTKPIGQDCTVEKRADQCCPIVTCPDVPVDLLTSTSTTSPAEYGATGVGKLDKYGCSMNGKYFPEGSKVPPTPNKPCEHCYCIRNMTTCVMQECTLHVDGCTPIYHKDVCCPVRYSCDHPEDEMPLLDDMSTTVRPTPGFLLTTTTISPVTQMTQDCVHDDQMFADGALIKTEKACEHCYCMKGDIVCVVQECGMPMENEGKNCTSLPPRDGQCCPDTYICEEDELSTEQTTEIILDKDDLSTEQTTDIILDKEDKHDTEQTTAVILDKEDKHSTEQTTEIILDKEDKHSTEQTTETITDKEDKHSTEQTTEITIDKEDKLSTEQTAEITLDKEDKLSTEQNTETTLDKEDKLSTEQTTDKIFDKEDKLTIEQTTELVRDKEDKFSTEPSTEIILDKLTTLTPPRRSSIEGSGYRNEPDEVTYTKTPNVNPEYEGSGEEQITVKPFDAPEELPSTQDKPTDDIHKLPDRELPLEIDESQGITQEPFLSQTTISPSSERIDIADINQEENILPVTFDQEYIPAVTTSSIEKEVDTTEDYLLVTEQEDLSPHQYTPSSHAPESYDGISTEPGDLFNTVPIEETSEPHKHVPSILVSMEQETEISTPSVKEIESESEHKFSSPSSITETTESSTESDLTTKTTKTYDIEKHISSTLSATIDDTESNTLEPEHGDGSKDIEKHTDSTELYSTTTVKMFTKEGEKATTEPDHLQNTVVVAEEDSIQGTLKPLDKEEELTTPQSLDIGSGEEDITQENVVEPHELDSISHSNKQEGIITTTEPDNGLYTIQGETTPKDSSKSSLPDETFQPDDTKTTVSLDNTVNTEHKSTIETFTSPSLTTVSRGDQYTVTTEPSFRKEDQMNVSSEKSEHTEVTTSKSYFTDEELLPASPPDENLSTGAIITTQDESTTMQSDIVSDSKEPTVESVTEYSELSEMKPDKVSDSSEQESDMSLGSPSTEKISEITTSAPKIESYDGPSRIPGEGDCLLNGITYTNNSGVPSNNKCHSDCKCLSSIIQCDTIICSPPPDYMHNCQSIYDTPDSCCPTYVCDHPRETVPPQSDNQMSQTESPLTTSSIACRGDQCEIITETEKPEEPETSVCGSEGCSENTPKPIDSQIPLEHHDKCTDGKCGIATEDCSSGDCQSPQIQGEICSLEHGCQAIPIKPCEGEHCKVISDDVPLIPTLCENENECADVQKQQVPCEGDLCKFDMNVDSPSSEKEQEHCKDELSCKQQQPVEQECKEESCKKTEAVPLEEKITSECEGTQCVQQIETSTSKEVVHSSDQYPKQEIQPAVTEKSDGTEKTDSQDMPTKKDEYKPDATEAQKIDGMETTKSPSLEGSYTEIPEGHVTNPLGEFTSVQYQTISQVTGDTYTTTSYSSDLNEGSTSVTDIYPSKPIVDHPETPKSDDVLTTVAEIEIHTTENILENNLDNKGHMTTSTSGDGYDKSPSSNLTPTDNQFTTSRQETETTENKIEVGVSSPKQDPSETTIHSLFTTEAMISEVVTPSGMQEEVYTDIPDTEFLDVKPQETKPQEGSEKPVTEPQEGSDKPSIEPQDGYEKPMIEAQDGFGVPATPKSTEIIEPSTGMKEIYTKAPEALATEDYLTEEPQIAEKQHTKSPDHKDYVTEVTSSVTEPEKSFTEVEDSFVTGKEDITTLIPDQNEYSDSTTERLGMGAAQTSTESNISSVTELQEFSTKATILTEDNVTDTSEVPHIHTSDVPITEKPESLSPTDEADKTKYPETTSKDVDSEKPQTTATTEKDIFETESLEFITESFIPTEKIQTDSVTKLPSSDISAQEEHATESEKFPEIQAPVTELLTTVETEDLHVPHDDSTDQQEKTTKTPYIEDSKLHYGTQEADTDTAVPTIRPELEYSKEPVEITTKPSQKSPEEIPLENKTTNIPDIPTIQEDVTTEPQIKLEEKPFTDSITVDEMRTELPVLEVSDASVTEKQDTVTASSAPQENVSTEIPDEALTKSPEIPIESVIKEKDIPKEDESATKTPEYTKVPEQVIPEKVTKSPDEAEPETAEYEGTVTTTREGIKSESEAPINEELVTKMPEKTIGPVIEVSGQDESLTETPEYTMVSEEKTTKQERLQTTEAPESVRKPEKEITEQEQIVTNAPDSTILPGSVNGHDETTKSEIEHEEKITKGPEDVEIPITNVAMPEESVTNTYEDSKKPDSNITGLEDIVTNTYKENELPETGTVGYSVVPEYTKESEPDVIKQEDVVTKSPYDFNEPEIDVTDIPEDTKIPDAQTTMEGFVTKVFDYTEASTQELVTKEPSTDVTRHEDLLTTISEDTGKTVQEELVTKTAVDGEQQNLVTEVPDSTKSPVGETPQEELATKKPGVEVTEQGELIISEEPKEATTRIPQDTKAPEEGITYLEGDISTISPEHGIKVTDKEQYVTETSQYTNIPEHEQITQDSEILEQESLTTKAPEVSQVAGQGEIINKSPEHPKDSDGETTSQEEKITKGPDDTKIFESTVPESTITRAPEITVDYEGPVTKQPESVTKLPEKMKAPVSGDKETVTKSPEETKLPGMTTEQDDNITKTPEEIEEPEVVDIGQTDVITKAPEMMKEPESLVTVHEDITTHVSEEEQSELSDTRRKEHQTTKAPEDTNTTEKVYEDTKESEPEIGIPQEKVTKSPEDVKTPEIEEEHEHEELVTEAPKDSLEVATELNKPDIVSEVTTSPEDTNNLELETTKPPEDIKEAIKTSVVTSEEETVTKAPEYTKEAEMEVTSHDDIGTKAPEHVTEYEITKTEEFVTKLPELVKEPEVIELEANTTSSTEETIELESGATEKVETEPEDAQEGDTYATEVTRPDIVTEKQETTSPDVVVESQETTTEQPQEMQTTPELIILEEHTHKAIEETSTVSNVEEELITVTEDVKEQLPFTDTSTEKPTEEHIETVTQETDITTISLSNIDEKIPPMFETTETESKPVSPIEEITNTFDDKEITTSSPSYSLSFSEKLPIPETGVDVQTETLPSSTEKIVYPESSYDITTKGTTEKQEEEIVTPEYDDKLSKPIGDIPSKDKPSEDIPSKDKPSKVIPSKDKPTEDNQSELKPSEPSEIIPTAESPKPIAPEPIPTDELPVPEEDGFFPPSGMGYGEPEEGEDDQAFGPGTCRYGGKVYVSAQQIPRDDPCDFCFCFRSDIICLQQSCPPPIHGCHEEPIQGFCCPRYECPVSMATTVNVTTTTTTTTTTLPPHFPTHSYKGAAQRRGCQIKGHIYKVGEVVRSASGPCLHCTCGGDGQMKCDPKACTPEPMLRQMIAAAVSAKRRR